MRTAQSIDKRLTRSVSAVGDPLDSLSTATDTIVASIGDLATFLANDIGQLATGSLKPKDFLATVIGQLVQTGLSDVIMLVQALGAAMTPDSAHGARLPQHSD
jgi:hypothetical protein